MRMGRGASETITTNETLKSWKDIGQTLAEELRVDGYQRDFKGLQEQTQHNQLLLFCSL